MIIGVVPARLGSKRLPKKILALLDGKPMVAPTMERALAAEKLDRVILAIDSEETREVLKDFNYEMIMTSKEHLSGTDRVAEVAQVIEEGEVFINIQGDEPLLDPSIIDGLVDKFQDNSIGMATVVSRKLTVSDLLNPNIVKAILDEKMNAVEFKRNIFDLEIGGVYRHIGMYGYRRNTLFQFTMLDPSERELDRSLEQMRALDNHIPIRALITASDNWAIDTDEDLQKVKQVIENSTKEDNRSTI